MENPVIIGNATLYCGDMYEILPQIDLTFDAILTDPPYGCTDCHWDKKLNLAAMWEMFLKSIKENATMCVFCQQPFATDLINSNRKNFRYEMIWIKDKKTNFLNANKMPMRSHENIAVFYQHLPTYNPQKIMLDRTYKKRQGSRWTEIYRKCVNPQIVKTYNSLMPSTVLNFGSDMFTSSGAFTTQYPTQKPVLLMEWLVKTYTNEGELVLDPFLGSGSTGIACINTNRRFIGIEKDADRFALACERISKSFEQEKESDRDLFSFVVEKQNVFA